VAWLSTACKAVKSDTEGEPHGGRLCPAAWVARCVWSLRSRAGQEPTFLGILCGVPRLLRRGRKSTQGTRLAVCRPIVLTAYRISPYGTSAMPRGHKEILESGG